MKIISNLVAVMLILTTSSVLASSPQNYLIWKSSSDLSVSDFGEQVESVEDTISVRSSVSQVDRHTKNVTKKCDRPIRCFFSKVLNQVITGVAAKYNIHYGYFHNGKN